MSNVDAAIAGRSETRLATRSTSSSRARARRGSRHVTTGEIFAALPKLEPETDELAAIFERIEASGVEGHRRDHRGASAAKTSDAPRVATSPPTRPVVATPTDRGAGRRRPGAERAPPAAPTSPRAPPTRAHRGRRLRPGPHVPQGDRQGPAAHRPSRRSRWPSASRPGCTPPSGSRTSRGAAVRRGAGVAAGGRGRRRDRQEAAHRGQPAPRGVDRQALRRSRAWRCSTSCRRATSA